MEQHRCAICLHEPAEPTQVAGCGHEFCLACLTQWCRTRRQPRCPLCTVPIQHLVRNGQQQAVPPPDNAQQEEGPPDLGCLDHQFFRSEADRLLRRARSTQMAIVRNCESAFNCGRQGSAAAGDASDTLQQVIIELGTYWDSERPFDPASALHELQSLDELVTAIAAGDWEASAAGLERQAATRVGAADAATGAHAWDEDSEDCSASDDDGLDAHTRRRVQQLERGSRGSTPARQGAPRRRSSSGSLGGGGGGGGARRR